VTVRVLVVDDHPIVRGGLVALLQGQPDVEVVGEASNAAEAISRADDTMPDVVLTDLRLGPGGDGVDITKALRHTASGPAVVILTTYDHDVDIVRAVEAGAAGYLLKDADPQAIIAAIRTAAAGGIVLDESQERRVVESMRVRRVDLSGREREVLALVADGLSNREIAKALFLSEATVKTHLVHAFDKLGVDSRTAAVAAARAAGVID
jgi:DNA-binding NarL/FixJ family response regulator